ncbi:polysaccharide lyase-like protein [Kribbella amoyensis]|uniref:Polysaccharide lyase-like protein n=1 Tax=Kribbella amoyensis TaxID=996641 RepID=A0A561C042_9ACTN|nr:heparin lyase I family protein [Kribbella amoyensis]TWD84523.1 polysaccharide lyase-like protein [Kribbella amoyensis]
MQISAPSRRARQTMALTVAATLSASLGFAAVTNARTADAATTAVPNYSVGIAGSSWTIENPIGCSPEIGQGGNYRDSDDFLQGKCQGAGQAPQTTGTDPRALTFRTDKDFEYDGAIVEDPAKNTWKDAAGNTLRDRTELATGWNLPFHTNVWVGFDVRIPLGVDDVTGSGAYVLQLWQCTANPFGGVRIQSGAGNGHNLQFVRRGEDPDTNYDVSMATQPLVPNEWHSFVIKYNVEPYHPGGPKGRIAVWHKTATGVEQKLFEREEYFGYATRSICQNDSFKNEFKVKFGMYKDYQPGATFRSDFRNLRVAGSKEAAQPYNRG